MSASLSHYMQAEHDRLFVGRSDEREAFREALTASPPPFRMMYIYGPGGVGKTSLLHAFRSICREEAVRAAYLDARDVEPAVSAFQQALRRTTGRDPGAAGGVTAKEDGRDDGERIVLMLDTAERLSPLGRWLRESFLPGLSGDVLVVWASRQAPPPSWRADLGLQAITRWISLRNLTRDEARRYLEKRKVDRGQQEAALRFSHGHPLALSLVADAIDQCPDRPFDPVDAPDMVAELVQRFHDNVGDPVQRNALAACALVRYMTEPLLAALLGRDDVHDVFAWLRTLSFMEAGRYGLFPHDLAREVLDADIRWRNTERYEALHATARHYYSDQLRTAGGHEHEAVLTDYLFLYRNNAVVKPLFARLRSQWHSQDGLLEDEAHAGDWPAVRAMVRAHEGVESAELLEYWRTRQPASATVYRQADGDVVGFALALALDETTEADRARDPAVRNAWTYLRDQAPLRDGETATLFRYWLARDTYQDVSPVQSLIAAGRVRHYLHSARLAYTFLPCADPGRWGLVFAYADLQRIPDADFVVGDQPYAMFGHDWRTVSPEAWLDHLAGRSIGATNPEALQRPPSATMLVLSEPDFADALKDALKKLSRTSALVTNPLVRTRFVVEEGGANTSAAERALVLRNAIFTASEALKASPREAKGFRALHATYLDPAPSQERAAERLGLPFSTFRRHLKRGIEGVTQILWQREVGHVSE